MREVNSCDFCGEAAAGTFEVVPPGRDPTGEGRRMVLCEGCRDTLGDVLEPLLGDDRAGGAGPDGEEREETAMGPTTIVAEPEREPHTGADAGTESGANAEGASPAPASGGSSGSESASDTGPEAANDADLGEALEDERTGAATGSRTDSASVEEAAIRSQSTGRGPPRGYRKVMRFLENREFPMDREEAETLAAEAYGVDRETVSAAIDHAVKHNRLREASGDLRQ